MQTIPIYIINLRRTPERRLQIQRQLDAFGLAYRFIEAVDSHDLSTNELNDLYPAGNAALACTLSHIKCYDEIIKNKHPIGCILEDDAELLPSFPDILGSKKLRNKNWDVLLLAHHITENHFLYLYHKYFVIPKNRFYLYHTTILGAMPGNFPRKIHGKHYIANPKISTSAQRPVSTMGYLVRMSAAKKLREIAHAERRFIFIDRVTGSADLFGMSLKLITPPCIKLNYTYTYYSNIRWFSLNMNNTNIPKKIPHPLPDQELLHRFMINKWSTLVILIIRSLFNKYRKKFVLRLLRSLIALELRNGINYFRPSKRYPPEVLLTKRYMENRQAKQ